MIKRMPKASVILQATDVLRRARKLPVGSARNDLRQLAQGLLQLHKMGIRANVQIVEMQTMGAPSAVFLDEAF